MSVGNYKYGSPNGKLIYFFVFILFYILFFFILADKRIFEDKYGKITNFNLHDIKLEKHLFDKDHENNENLFNFFICLSICHSIIVENDNYNLTYHSSSPDETALLNCARKFGFIYLEKDIQNNIKLEINGETQIYKLLNVIEYSSER